MLTERENYIQAMRYGKPDRIPYTMGAIQIAGLLPNMAIEMPLGGGIDAFGVEWVMHTDGPMPVNASFMMDDITTWREIVKLPDLDSHPWEEWAEDELEEVDRTAKVVYAMMNNGIFDRLSALMGFENGLIAMALEPEECYEFFSAVADYKVEYINKLHEHYQPDVIHYVDDLAQSRGLFMSPDTYRKLIKPHHKRIIEAIRSRPNVIATQHTCGKCEEIIPDFVEIGAQSWYPAQTENDLKGLKKRFKGMLAFEHGLDSQGVFANPDITEDEIRSDVRRAIDDLAEGGGLSIMPTLLGITMQDMLASSDRRQLVVIDEHAKYGTYSK